MALRSITELTTTRARSVEAQRRDDAELRGGLQRLVPALIEALEVAARKLEDWPLDDPAAQGPAVRMARAFNAQPDPDLEVPC